MNVDILKRAGVNGRNGSIQGSSARIDYELLEEIARELGNPGLAKIVLKVIQTSIIGEHKDEPGFEFNRRLETNGEAVKLYEKAGLNLNLKQNKWLSMIELSVSL